MTSVLIIGATSCIAEHCSKIWSSRGYKLYLVGRNEERTRSIELDLKVRGAAKVSSYISDLNNFSKHSEILDKAEKFLEKIDIVFIAHGSLPIQKKCENSIQDTLNELNTNAISTISFLTLVANLFEIKKHGKIVVISSVAGDRGRATNYIYGSSKAMVAEFLSGLRQRLYKSNVKVLTIKPGFVDTPMTSHFKKGLLWSKPNKVAFKIVKSIDKQKEEVYVPSFWFFIMIIIKSIPNFIFKRLRL